MAEYFEAERIVLKDRLLTEAVAVLDGLSKPGRDLLRWEELATTAGSWNGQHTRVADRWIERSVPLLEVTRESGDRKEWGLTAFGAFVKELWENGYEAEDVAEQGLPTAISDDTVEEALDLLETADMVSA